MYQIYTQTRPGRPRWALAACAGLLALALILAALLSAGKTRGTPIPLQSSPTFFPAGRLSIQLPAGWTQDDSRLASIPGVVSVNRKPGGVAETVIVFRGIPRPHGIPSVDATESLRDILFSPEPMIENQSEPAFMGSLPAWTLELSPDSARSQSRLHYLGRACLAPDGQIAGVVLALAGPPTREDRRLLDNMSDSLSIKDLDAAGKPQDMMKEAGITFDPPEGARFFRSATVLKTLPRLHMAGGDGRTCWYLSATRLPLIGSRKVAELVEQQARTLLEQLELSEPLQTATIGNRPVSWTRVTLPSNTAPSILVWGAETDEHTAILLAGRYEPEAEENLRAAAEAVIAGSISPIADVVDIDQAMETGRQHLGDLLAGGIERSWGQRSTEVFAIHSPSIVIRTKLRTYQPQVGKDGFRWWKVGSAYHRAGGLNRLPPDFEEEYLIRNDGASHGGVCRERRGHGITMVYTERRQPGGSEVLCELTHGDGKPAAWNVSVDDTYACEPILMTAGAKVAADPDRRAAIFSDTEIYCSTSVYWIMIPLGEQPLPGETDGAKARAVCLLRDCGPTPIICYYDEDDSLKAVSFEDVIWVKRLQENQDAESPSPGRGRPR
ncbi:MAG TPA: hypothetical protein VLM89_17730 [Phycisphaerae bacterium]|nr:hypothetical protein [Phycisphaerae bacterium]